MSLQIRKETTLEAIKTAAFFMKYRVYKRAAISCYRTLLRNQDLSPDELFDLTWHKTRRILYHAFEAVPYYRAKFNAMGLHPNDVVYPEDYSKVPLLTREDLRCSVETLVASNANRKQMRVSSTGGSSGMPVKVFHDRRFPDEALGWRMLSWWGLKPGVDAAYVWRLTRQRKVSQFLNSALWWPTRRIRLDASAMAPHDMIGFVRAFNELEPRLLQGYVGAIDFLASHVEDNAVQMHAPSAIWLTSSPCSEVQRRRIERAFGAPVYDQYGCGEVFWLAAQCKDRNRLHMFSDARYIEFVDEWGVPRTAGETGQIAITDLENYAFPLIRYVNGDLGRSSPGRCSCEISLPLMDQVRGRVTDLIKLPDGTCISGDYITTLFDEWPEAIRAFQVRQESDSSIGLFVVSNPNYENLPRVLDRVRSDLLVKTGKQVPFRIEVVDNIAADRGKTRFVVSDVK
jgi:phenylacetate-CoA ligase